MHILFRSIVTTISGSPVLLKALRDKQDNPHLSFQFEVPASLEEESDEDLDESTQPAHDSPVLDSQDLEDHSDYLQWGRTRKVIKDIVTRWNSTFYMLERAVEIREAFDFVLIDTGRLNISPSNREWNSASLLCSFLIPFAVVTDILQGEKYPTLGCVSRYISLIYSKVQ